MNTTGAAQQYRPLEIGEAIRKGDEWQNEATGTWQPASLVIPTVPEHYRDRYRRPLIAEAGTVASETGCTPRQLLAQLQAWKLAALQCGLYRSDTDTSSPEKWKSAQLQAATQLLTQRDELAAFHQKLSGLLIAAEGDDLCEVVENICNQRDALLAALERIASGHPDGNPAILHDIARAAIRSVKP